MTKPVAHAMYEWFEGAFQKAKLMPYWDARSESERYRWITADGVVLARYDVVAGARYMVDRALESRKFSEVACYRHARKHFIPKKRGPRKKVRIVREDWGSY